MANRIFLVEDFVYRVEVEGRQPSEDEIRRVGELLGQPTRKLDVVLGRYSQVFAKQIERRCSSIGSRSICIYSWRVGAPFRPFPAAMHAFGTIILFEGERPSKVLAYPFSKPLSYAKSPGLSEEEYRDKVPREVTARVDGWQITAYYNPVLGRWSLATRHALHNMYFARGRLVEEPLDSVANPYVAIANAIAERDGLYERLRGYEGWTFTFVLEGPEPAITRPPYPIGAEPGEYGLYLLMARDPEGRLLTWSEAQRLLGYRGPPQIEPRPLGELYGEVRRRLDVRSYFALLDVGDPEEPLIAELESELYPDAMNVKHLYDAKSAALLASEGAAAELARMLPEDIAARVRRLEEAYVALEGLLAQMARGRGAQAAARWLVEVLEAAGVRGLHVGEALKALGEGNARRVARKALALLLEGKSLATDEPVEAAKKLVEVLREGEAAG